MANTQTTVPKFTTLEVLSSADQNLTAGTGCPVFATTITRDAAFGGSGEKVLAEGQICYLESTNVVQLYDGAAWQTVGPAAAASSGLTRLASGTATAATRIDFTNIFSATYKNYRVILSNIANAQDNNKIYLLVGNSGTPFAMSGSYVSGYIRGYGTTTLNYTRTSSDFYLNGNMGTTNNFVTLDIFNPQAAKYTMVKASSLGTYTGNVFTGNEMYGQIQTATQYTDMFFENDSATNLGAIDYAIYGYEA
jgi:hypothetical protein